MMAGVSTKVGSAYVEVTPKATGNFKSLVESQMPSGDASGGKFGEGFGQAALAKMGTMSVAMGNLLSDAIGGAADVAKQVVGDAFNGFADYEQLSGGVQKIFDEVDYSRILSDAQNAYRELNMSANEYMESINQVGATFAQTMGDEAGYETARTGMQAISDYASGTGRNLDELNEKYALITRSTSSYQSIADQFSGILPATSKDFLEQATAAGYLAEGYQSLTEVPVAEYQQAVTQMLAKGVSEMGLAGNTLSESTQTISGSLAMAQSAWENWLAALGRDDVDMGQMTGSLIDSVVTAASLVIPKLAQVDQSIATQLPGIVATLAPTALAAINSLITVIAAQLPGFVTGLVTGVMAMLPGIASALVTLSMTLTTGIVTALSGIVDNLPDIIMSIVEAVPAILSAVAGAFVAGAPALLQAGIQLFGSIVQAIPAIVSRLLAALPSLIGSILTTLAAAAPQLLTAGVQMFGQLLTSLAQAAPQIIGGIIALIPALAQTIIACVPQIISAGVELFKGLGQGLMQVLPEVGAALEYFVTHLPEIIASGVTAIAQGAKDLFGGIVDGIMGNVPDAQQAAAELGTSATQAALDSSDGTSAGENLSQTMLAAFDFSGIEESASAGIGKATEGVAASVDASAISEQIMESATGSLDTSKMDPPATDMADNAVQAALSVDATEIGRQFSAKAASGIDTNAMSSKAAEMASAAKALNQTATVSVSADMSGVDELKAGASAVSSALQSMQSVASAAMAAVAQAASAAAPAFTRLASTISSAMSRGASAAASAASSIRSSMNIPSKTVNINVAPGSVALPHFSMNGTFDPKSGSVPSVSVSWYAKGGIFAANSPQLIGVGDARVPEVVAPLDRLESMLGLGESRAADDRPNVYVGEISVSPQSELYQLLVQVGERVSEDRRRRS